MRPGTLTRILSMKKPLERIIKGVNILFVFLSFCLFVVVLFFPQKAEEFVGWIGIKIQFIGSWNYLLGFAISIIESFPFIGTLLPGQEIVLLIGGFI